MRKVLLTLAAVAVVAVLLPLAIAVPTVPPQLAIVPGEAIAGVRLGSAISKVIAQLGAPSDRRPVAGGTMYVFWRYAMNAYVRGGVVYAVSTTNSLMRSAEGVTLGSRAVEVQRAYGRPTASGRVEGFPAMVYDSRGIAFGLSRRAVAVVLVFRAGGIAEALQEVVPPPQARAPEPAQPAPEPQAAQPEEQASAQQTSGAAAQQPESAEPAPAQPAASDAPSQPAATSPAAPAYSRRANYMSRSGYLRYLVYSRTGLWITHAEARDLLSRYEARLP